MPFYSPGPQGGYLGPRKSKISETPGTIKSL